MIYFRVYLWSLVAIYFWIFLIVYPPILCSLLHRHNFWCCLFVVRTDFWRFNLLFIYIAGNNFTLNFTLHSCSSNFWLKFWLLRLELVKNIIFKPLVVNVKLRRGNFIIVCLSIGHGSQGISGVKLSVKLWSFIFGWILVWVIRYI